MRYSTDWTPEFRQRGLCNLGKDGGGGETRQTVQTSEPWKPQGNELKRIFSRARGLSGQEMEYFPDQGYVDFRPETTEALDRISARARSGSPLREAGGETMLATARGDFLNANPYLDEMMDAASQGVVKNYRNAVLPGIDLGRIKSGRYGSGAHTAARESATDSLGRTLGNLSAQIYGGNYQQERGRQMAAAGAAPGYAATDYDDAARLAGVGATYEGLDEAELADRMARYSFQQEEPWERLGRYSALVSGGNWGGTSTSAEPFYTNRAAGILGGAATGAGVAQTLGYGAESPWGWGLAAGGGLLGAF